MARHVGDNHTIICASHEQPCHRQAPDVSILTLKAVDPISLGTFSTADVMADTLFGRRNGLIRLNPSDAAMGHPDDPERSAAILTPRATPRQQATCRRALYVTGSGPAIKRRVTACRPTVAPVDGLLAAAVELTAPRPCCSPISGFAPTDLRPLRGVTSATTRLAAAHVESLHADAPRDFCHDCEAVA